MCDCGYLCAMATTTILLLLLLLLRLYVNHIVVSRMYTTQPIPIHSPPAVVVLEQPTGDLLNVFVRIL